MSETQESSRILLEVCVESVADAVIACEAGADRLELNCALALGGLTPSAGLLQECLDRISIPIIAMCRPRPGDFCYSADEFQTMLRDAQWMLSAGAAGIAFGMLTSSGAVDGELTKRMRSAIGDRTAVFHRAFDLTIDQLAALETLVDAKVDRVLTSGGAQDMLQGEQTIQQLQSIAAGRIQILPGCGLHEDIVESFLERTKCGQVHGSLSAVERASTTPLEQRLKFVDPAVTDESRRLRTSAERVRSMRNKLDAISARSSRS